MIILWILAIIGILGSLLLVVVASVRIAFFRFRPSPLSTHLAEIRLLQAALLAAILGSVLLFVLPVYSSVVYTGSASTSGVASSSLTSHSSTFLQVNGPQVIPLFTVPVLFAVVPFAFARLRVRPIVAGACAFLLAGQAAVGMSGYGLFFAPSSVLMVLAGFVSIFGGHRPTLRCSRPAEAGG
jgi:hypothetical protein